MQELSAETVLGMFKECQCFVTLVAFLLIVQCFRTGTEQKKEGVGRFLLIYSIATSRGNFLYQRVKRIITQAKLPFRKCQNCVNNSNKYLLGAYSMPGAVLRALNY